MSPTIFRELGFRFFFFSREEPRMHVHIHCGRGEAKFWLEPVRLERSFGFSRHDINAIQVIVDEHLQSLLEKWDEFFRG